MSDSTPATTFKHDPIVKKDKAKKMIKHYKDARGKKKEPHWVQYDADYFRELLKDESIRQLKFITAAYTDEDGGLSGFPTILVQLKQEGITTTFSYRDAYRSICPPPDGTCDTDTSIE